MALQQSYSVAETLQRRGYRFCLNVETFKFWKDGVKAAEADENGKPRESCGAYPAFTLHLNDVSAIEAMSKSEEDILRMVDSTVRYGTVSDLTEVKLREVENRGQEHIKKLEDRMAEMQRRLDLNEGSKELPSVEKPLLDAEAVAAPDDFPPAEHKPENIKKHWKTLAKEAREAAARAEVK